MENENANPAAADQAAAAALLQQQQLENANIIQPVGGGCTNTTCSDSNK
jgi:hypothetical protein